MSYVVRKAEQKDIPGLKLLLDGYYNGEWRGSIERLERDLSRTIFEIHLLENAACIPGGFLSWTLTYDMNWCMVGGEIIDFYIIPTLRGRGGALLMAACVAELISKMKNKQMVFMMCVF